MFLSELNLTRWYFYLAKSQRRLLSRKILNSPYIKTTTKEPETSTAKHGMETSVCLLFSAVMNPCIFSVSLVTQWKQKISFIRYQYCQSHWMQFLNHLFFKIHDVTCNTWLVVINLLWVTSLFKKKWEICVPSPQKNTSAWRNKWLCAILAVSWIVLCKIIDILKMKRFSNIF